MLKNIFIIVSWMLSFMPNPAHGSGTDTLWIRISQINDSDKSKPAEKLQLLLSLQTPKDVSFRPDSSYAYLLRSIAKQYNEQGDFINAARYYKQSADVIHSNANRVWINPDHLLIAYYRLYVVYDSLNQVSDELKYLDSCIFISTKGKIINLYSLSAVYKKAEYLFDVGDYNNCIIYATMCEKMGRSFASGPGQSDHEIGMEYVSSSGMWIALAYKALKNFQVADSLLTRQLKESEREGTSFNAGDMYAQMADLQMQNHDFKQAIIYYEKALKVEAKAGHPVSCKGILDNLGYSLYYENLRDHEAALKYLRKALQYTNTDKEQTDLDAAETLNVLASMANVFAGIGLYDSAFTYFQLALGQISPGIKEEDLTAYNYDRFAKMKKVQYLIDLLIDKGTATFEQYKTSHNPATIRQAIHTYKIADQLLDRIKGEQSDLESKLFWRADTRRLYERAIEACHIYQNVDDAFYFFEKSRAVLLNDQLTEQRWLGEEDIQRQTQIKKKILRLMGIANSLEKNSGEYTKTQDELFNSRRELEQLMLQIKERDPLYYQSFIDQQMVSLSDIRKNVLSDRQGLVEIFSGDSAVYVLIIGQKKTDFRKLDKHMFDSLSQVYLSFLSNESRLNAGFGEFVNASRSLYGLIFDKNILPAGRILISPEGQYFPFESLVISKTSEPVKYLLMDYAVGYTYSARYLMNSFLERRDLPSNAFLGVAPVRYASELRLSDLRESDLSLTRINAFFKPFDNLTHADATKAGFMQRFSKYSLIQLYTHASAEGRNNEPVIYFSDSSLNLSELLGEDKPVTRLIVLSACESATGKIIKGEGVFSLNRGFAALGIPSSVSNLWSVDDRATYRLTELFYKNLSENLPMDIAMQRAKIEFIKTAAHAERLPYYWAAPILIGNSNALNFNKDVPWKVIIEVIGLLSVTFTGAYYLSHKKLRSAA
jgi:CHAT domain-containing protein